MKPIVTWILIADGGQAKVYEHAGPGQHLKLVDGMHFEQKHLKAGDIMADRPGRSFSSVGHGRSAIEPSSDPVEERERKFVEVLGGVLEKHHEAGDFDRLIIAAAPTALGDLRPVIGHKLRNAITAELPKDLTHTPLRQLDAYFAELLPV